MKSSAAKIQMTSYEELFETGDNADSSVEKVLEIPLSDLYPFKNHPFKAFWFRELPGPVRRAAMN